MRRSDQLFVAALAFVGTGVVMAQSVPPNANPESLGNVLKPDVEKVLTEPSQVDGPVLIGPESPDDLKSANSSIRFVLKRIIVEPPSHFLPKEQLDKLVEQYENRPIGLSDLYELINSINRLYARKGLVTCRAVLPPQKIKDGTVRIRLIEGRLDEIRFQGRKQTQPAFLLEALGTKSGDIVAAPALQARIQRFNRINTVGMKAALRPGRQFGTTTLDIEVYEPPPFQLELSLDNAGASSTGELQSQASLVWNQPRGKGDRLVVGLLLSQGNRNFSVGYQWPSAPLGGRWLLSGGVGQTEIIEGPFRSLDIRGDSRNVSAGYLLPLETTNRRYVGVTFKGEYLVSNTDIAGQPLSRTTVRSFGVDVDFQWLPKAVAGLSMRGRLAYRRAAAETLLRNVDFNKANLTATGVYRFATAWLAQAEGAVGWSDNAYVPPSQQFHLGGFGSIPGYEPAEVSAEKGYRIATRLGRYFSGYGKASVFYSAGEVLPENGQNRRLASVGVEVAWNIPKWKNMENSLLQVVVAHPLEQVRSDLNTWRIYGVFRIPFLL